jgi:CheY-like chemotaxis protein
MKKILLVDDTKTVLMFETMMLRGGGYRLSTACDGEDALKKVEQDRPDLIILDIMMPVLNGIDTCKHLKSNADTMDIPVVMVTTKGEPEMVEKAFEAGCNDYLTKPVDKIELLTKVRAHLNG